MQAESGSSVVRALETVLISDSPENRRELVRAPRLAMSSMHAIELTEIPAADGLFAA